MAEREPVTATILTVGHDEMRDGVVKPIVTLSGFDKPCIVNKTNADVLYMLAGTDDDVDWPGTVVELFTTLVRSLQGGKVLSICFRPAKKAPAKD